MQIKNFPNSSVSAAILCIMVILQGCTYIKPKTDEQIASSQTAAAHEDNKQSAPSNSLPIVQITQAELNLLVEGKWSDTLVERLKESKFDEKKKKRAVGYITIAGIGPLQCTEAYELLRVEDIDIASEVWVVNLCGEKKVLIDSSGNVLEVGDVIFSALKK